LHGTSPHEVSVSACGSWGYVPASCDMWPVGGRGMQSGRCGSACRRWAPS